MNIKVLSIKRTTESGTFEVAVLIGSELHQFQMSVELDRIANREIQTIASDEKYRETFRCNFQADQEISKLVSKFYNCDAIELPAYVGEFYPDTLANLDYLENTVYI